MESPHEFTPPVVVELKTWRRAHRITPDDFIESGILAQVIEFPIKPDEPEPIAA